MLIMDEFSLALPMFFCLVAEEGIDFAIEHFEEIEVVLENEPLALAHVRIVVRVNATHYIKLYFKSYNRWTKFINYKYLS
jgi:hypothetical protein